MFEIRLATIDDLPAILAISNEAALHTVANFAAEPEPLSEWQEAYRTTADTHPWLVAAGNSGLLGFAKASPWSARCAYDYSVEVTVYVDPTQHRRGIGRALYGKLFEILTLQGYRSAIAGITLPNEASVGLHERFGMSRVATFESVGWKFGKWHDVGYWQRQLQPESTDPPSLQPVSAVISAAAVDSAEVTIAATFPPK